MTEWQTVGIFDSLP